MQSDPAAETNTLFADWWTTAAVGIAAAAPPTSSGTDS
jgi:hypothetical protein